MFAKKNIPRVSGSLPEKLKAFGAKLPFALMWYTVRFLRQNATFFAVKFLMPYGFSSIGRKVVFDGFPSFLFPCSKIVLSDRVRIGKHCVFQGTHTSIITLGRNVTINDGCHITSMFSIEIGEGTSIGEYTSLRDYNHRFDNIFVDIKSQDYFGAPIVIGKNAWIGRGCIILPGVTIGDGAVIGANSVVNKDIPGNVVAAGVPIKIIKNRTDE